MSPDTYYRAYIAAKEDADLLGRFVGLTKEQEARIAYARNLRLRQAERFCNRYNELKPTPQQATAEEQEA